jgi:TPR repeat protein
MDEAILWWERAAQQGHPEAQYLCGLYYHDTAGHKDLERARHWLDKAAQQGHPEAIRMKEEYGYC